MVENSYPSVGTSEGGAPRVMPEPMPALQQEPPKPRFRWLVIGVVVALVVMLLTIGGASYYLYRQFSGADRVLSELQPFVDRDYPEYKVMDYTRQGFILQSEKYEELRLDVRYFKVDQEADWQLQPLQSVSPTWRVNDSFFRHPKGGSADPRTGMTYDVAGFVEAYAPLRPGPNAVVMGVWLDEEYSGSDFEIYEVFVARRDPGEPIWPDHISVFSRDAVTGEWVGDPFKPLND